MKWLYNVPMCTGLGDRLGIIMALSALARLHNNFTTVHMEWCEDPQRVLQSSPYLLQHIPKWSGYNYSLDNLSTHINLPINVKFFSSNFEPSFKLVRMGHEAPPFHGIPQTSTMYWKALKLSDTVWRKDEYINAYKTSGKELTSRVEPKDTPYVLVHFRGPDDNTAIQNQIPFCTRDVIHKLQDAGVRIRIISNNYTHTMKWLKKISSIEIVHGGNEFTDLQLVIDAISIVQHASGGWSAFSSVISMAKSIPLINTFYSEYQHRYGILSEYGDIPEEFYTCQEINKFISTTMSRRFQSSDSTASPRNS